MNAVVLEPVSCTASNLCKGHVMGAKSLSVQLAALKGKTKQAHLLYAEKSCDTCHILLICQFFIPHNLECMSTNREKKPEQDNLEGTREVKKKRQKQKSNSPDIQNPKLHPVDVFKKLGFY
jgi:hypothetical protein